MRRLLGLATALLVIGAALTARSNMVLAPWGGAGTTSGVTTWDPAQKGAGITLSPDGRTATSPSTSWAAVRSVTSRVAADGKRYFELGCDGVPSDNTWGGGVESASGSLVNFLGQDAFGSGYFLFPSVPKTMWWYNNAGNDMASSPPCASSSANRIHYAFDATAGLIWSQVYTAGVGSGRWNGILVTSPAAPTANGWTVPFAGPYFIAWSGENSGSSKIYNDASNIEGPVPTGYVVWNSTGAAVPVNTALPAVTGSTSVGSVLTSTNGTWTNSPTSFAYQWKQDGTTNIGTSVNTYTIVSADQGHSITDVVTASNASGAGAPATSNSVSIPGGSGTCAESSQFFARAGTLDTAHHNAYDTMICGLVTDGVWGTLDAYYMLATDVSANALISLVSAAYPLTVVGAPTFTANNGYSVTEGSTGDYLSSTFNPTTASSPKFTATSSTIALWLLDTAVSANPIIGAYDGTSIAGVQPKFTDNKAYSQRNSGAGQNASGTVADAHGLTTGVLLGGTNTVYDNTTAAGSVSQADTTLVNNTFYVLSRHDNTGPSPGRGGIVPLAAWGAGLTSTQVIALHDRACTYLNTIRGATTC